MAAGYTDAGGAMKRDLDREMAERGLDGIFVSGRVRDNPTMYYMTNGAKLTRAHVFQKRGGEPVLFCSPIEREEAAAAGIAVVNTAKYDYVKILRETGDRLAAAVEFYRRMFADVGATGRVGFYGLADQGHAWILLNALESALDDIEVYGDFEVTAVDAVRATKDAAEIDRIRDVGRRTREAVEATIEFLQSHRVVGGALVRADGSPLTIGHVHDEINRYIAERRLEDPEGIIFSIGRDAGVPHSTGRRDDVLELGKTIVFDIFPREAGGGYFFDLTRTYCLGYAPPEVERAYRDVSECVDTLVSAYAVGREARCYQRMTCDFFAARGHPTVADDTQAEAGYIHSVGHGVGLAVHEEPYFSDVPTNVSVLEPGHVFTCEPGLYYPERGYGVRIEDVIWIDEYGATQNLTDFPRQLVIEV
jgi:Xaa-Pro aminopeptidase